jgi:hypothetical protein
MISIEASSFYHSWFDDIDSFGVGKWNGNSIDGALRFTGINLSQGTQIQSAILGIYVGSKGNGSGDLVAVIKGIDEDNTGDWSGSPFGRSETSAEDSANWSLPPAGEYSNHDVTSIVQEILNRSGWQSGNAMGFYVFNNGSPDNVYVFESSNSPQSKLEIVISSPSLSPSRSPSRSISKSPSPTPSASISPSPSVSPPIPERDFGIKISKDGFDVKKSTIYQDVFTSKKGVLGKRKTGTFTVATSDGYANDSTSTGLDYIPIVFVTVTCRDGTVINVPGGHESDWSKTEVLDESFTYYLGDGIISFTAHAYHCEPVQGGSSTELDGQEYTFKILYCFNELSIEE